MGDGVLVKVALGDGKNVGVAEVCAVEAQATKNNRLIKNRLWYFLITLLHCGLQYYSQLQISSLLWARDLKVIEQRRDYFAFNALTCHQPHLKRFHVARM